MKMTQELLALGMYNNELTKGQTDVLGLEYPLIKGWEYLILEKEITQREENLFLLLKGKLSLVGQKQIIKNYELLSVYHKEKKEAFENKTTPEKIKNLKKETKEMKNYSKIVTIYCDGACQGNPGKAGSGLAIYTGEDKPKIMYGGYESRGTNNTAELNALYQALLLASLEKKALIYSDSRYSIDAITIWAYGWKKKGWKKKGGEIKNLALIKIMHALYEEIKHKVKIKHVKGHAGVEGNELADRMAFYAIVSKSEGYEVFNYSSIEKVLLMDEG